MAAERELEGDETAELSQPFLIWASIWTICFGELVAEDHAANR